MIALALRYWWAIALAALVALLGVQTMRLGAEKTAHAETRAAIADERTRAAQVAQQAEEAARTEEARREKEKTNAIKQARLRAESAAADARAAHAAADSLRGQLAAFVADASCPATNPGTASGSPPAESALDLLADLFSRSDDVAGILAEQADKARIAGLACEAQYDALTKD